AALAVAHAEGHEVAAVEEVYTAPVPARRFRSEIGTRPFVVEPGAALDAAAVDLAHRVQLRPAVVVARLAWTMTLAAEPALASQHRLAGEQRQVEVDLRARYARLVTLAFEFQAPVVDPDASAVELGVRQRQPGARGAFLVDEVATLRIGKRGVRE